MLHGNMQTKSWTITDIFNHGRNYHPYGKIVSRMVDGSVNTLSFSQVADRVCQLSHAISSLNLEKGSRIGTLAWNNHRHLEIYFGASCTGNVLHTINPRLFPEQLSYIINHAEDSVLFIDLTFVPLIEKIANDLKTVKHFVVLCDKEQLPSSSLQLTVYEDFISGYDTDFDFPTLDEETAAALCYTSGTTGNPKGVLYSHRSTAFHSFMVSSSAALAFDEYTTCLPVVPMFHVNAWGTPYAVAMTGANMVLPGAALDGKSLSELIFDYDVNLLMGVPTVWLGLLSHLREQGKKLDKVKRVVVGGSAAPRAMIKAFQEEHDTFLLHAWGMTEMSPMGTLTVLTPALERMELEKRYDVQSTQGKPVAGVEIEILDENGKPLPHDGTAFGRLVVRGPAVIQKYYKHEESAVDEDGWFDTGDVSSITPSGYMKIVDRSKDVIKSGGEWISSIELENAAVAHPNVHEACVIAAKHDKWDERPLMLVVMEQGQDLDEEQLKEFLASKVAKWWLPDAIVQVTELPHTATGKLLKTKLREEYSEHLIKGK